MGKCFLAIKSVNFAAGTLRHFLPLEMPPVAMNSDNLFCRRFIIISEYFQIIFRFLQIVFNRKKRIRKAVALTVLRWHRLILNLTVARQLHSKAIITCLENL